MVEYYIEAIDQQGRAQTLMLAAKNSTMADELVRSQGLQPTLIKHAKAHQREQQQEEAARRRRRQFGIVGAVLVVLALAGGAGTWVYIQRLQSEQGFSLDAVRTAAEQAGAFQYASGSDEELTAFARDLFGAMHLKFPGLVRSINAKSANLMFVHLNTDTKGEQTPETIRLVTLLFVESLQGAFENYRCTVLVLRDGTTVADGRFADGEASVSLHVEQ